VTGALPFLDHNAGAPPLPEVLDRFRDVELACPGNPASMHSPGRRARAELEAARQRIAAALGVDLDAVVFTSGGTESANLAVHGLGDPAQPVLLADVEHPAVREPARRRGIEPWSVDPEGRVQVARPARRVGLVCLVHAQSELGTVQPVAEAAALAFELRVPLFVDAAQSLGRLPLTPLVAIGAAFALSPHKCGGLRGHGVLVLPAALRNPVPLLFGGGQEHGLRPGTQSPALAAANALAIERAVGECARRAATMAVAREALLAGLDASGVAHRVLTPLASSVPNTAMVHFAAVDGRNLLPTLDLVGVHASHGSACSSGAPTPPRVLTAIGLDDASARACVRFSLGWRDEPAVLHELGRRIGAVVLARQKKP
jgi:cysteine desulfurase